MKRLWVLLLVCLLPVNALAFTSYRGHSSLLEPPPSSDGELLYQESGCVMCHGAFGDGHGFLADGLNPRPRDFTDYEQMKRVPDSAIITAIRNGIAGTAMPSHALFSDNQLQELVFYVRSLLAENYLLVNMCLTDTYEVKLGDASRKYIIKAPPHLEVKQAKKDALEIIMPDSQIDEFIKKGKTVVRDSIQLIQPANGDKEKEKLYALITVRVHNCIKTGVSGKKP